MRKGVEGLPLKYIIIVIAALLILDLVLEMTGVIRSGIMSSILNINQTTSALSGQLP